MILGALVAAGVEPRALQAELQKLRVSGFEVSFETANRSGISATRAIVSTTTQHSHRHLKDIVKIIHDSELSETVKARAVQIFTRLAEAEARVHNQPVERVHFHEVGALDAIVDVVGAAICFELLKIEKFICSALHVGSGTIVIEHGTFPVPPPAVSELLKGAPIYSTDIRGELVTPTGAAIIASVCEEFGGLPVMKVLQTGYGAGTREYEKFPNVLRVLIGESETSSTSEELWMLETNVDDMSSQVLGHVMDLALELGALDCFFTSIVMKKSRPAILISVLCRAESRSLLSEMIFRETTTLGLRSYAVNRQALEREVLSVQTDFGAIDVKVARLNGSVVKQMPEYEQCRVAAVTAKVPLRTVEEAVRRALMAAGEGK